MAELAPKYRSEFEKFNSAAAGRNRFTKVITPRIAPADSFRVPSIAHDSGHGLRSLV